MKRLEKEERKKEIREKALQLFLEFGYEKTSIQNILDALSLSKGGFYHHFKSKEELLNQIAIERAENLMQILLPLLERKDLSGLEKFILLFRINNNIQAENLDQLLPLWEKLYQEKNHLFRQKLTEKQIEHTISPISQIIAQAVEEGDFDTPYPVESVKLIFRYSTITMETVLPYLLEARINKDMIPEISKQYNFLFYTMERVLGARPGSLKIFPEGFFEEVFQ